MIRSLSANAELEDIYPPYMTTQEFILRIAGKTKASIECRTGRDSRSTSEGGRKVQSEVPLSSQEPQQIGGGGASEYRRRRISIVDMHREMIDRQSALFLTQLRIEQMGCNSDG